MYGGGENNGIANSRNIANRDTLHISPHIAAHKSSGSLHSSEQTIGETALSLEQANHSNSRITSIQHVPGYRIGIPTSTIFSEPFQHSIRTQSSHIQVPTIFTIPSSKALPQDLSAHSSKLTVSTADEESSQKPLPHIHTVGNQNLENIAGSLIVPVTDRTPTFYRLVDGTTISIPSQHHAVLVSQNDDQSTLHHSHMDPMRQNNHNENQSIPTSVSAGSVPVATMAGTVSSHQHASVGGLPEGHLYLLSQEMSNSGFLSSSPHSILPDREVSSMQHLEINKVKEEEHGEHKDLVRQALQAAVVPNSHKTNSNQNIIDYNYATEDVEGSNDCLVHENMICHSTFCPQPNVKPQELLLMNLNVNSGQQAANKLNSAVVVGSNSNESPSGGHMVMLEPASVLEEGVSVLQPNGVPSRRRRTRLSEEAQAIRREKIATRMREKRANETEEQKEKRRIREAERMRKKRALEDELSKARRRSEAAERARLRRAKLSFEERKIEREKAALRMRMRRQNENEEQKKLRRIKAAERMRKRRSVETPEERVARKRNIAMRMKARRQKKEEKEEKIEGSIGSPLNADQASQVLLEDDKRLVARDISSKETVIVPDLNGQYVPTGHLIVSTSVPCVSGSLSMLQSESSPNTSTHVLQSAIISAQEIHTSQSLSLQVKTTSSSPIQFADQQKCSPGSEQAPLPLHKSVVVTQQMEPGTHDSGSESRTTETTSVLSKISTSSHLSTHHHLPHLLHHLTPHQEQQHHHQHFLVPHQSQHSHQQSQPLQLRHQ